MNYKLLLENEYELQKRKIKNAKNIVLYGNSVVSCILDIALKELGVEAQCLVFDKGRFLSNKSIHTDFENTIVVLCSSRKNTRQSMKIDSQKYFPGVEIIDFYAIYYTWITKVVQRKCDYETFAETIFLCREDNCIPNIDSINTLFCNLKCKECSNGIQYRKEKRKIEAKSQVYHLSKITDKLPINQCNFQGGEVFTDVDFSEFVKMHSYNSRIGIFTVATNGTIMPKDEDFMTIKNTGCMIRISDYGVISKHKQNIINKCKELNIPCFVFPMAETWRKFGEYKKRNREKTDLKCICKECCFGTHDLMFVDDKIYCCLRTLYANAIGDSNDAMDSNTLDLDSEFTIEELKKFVNGENLWKMCDYCDFPMEEIQPAEQL